MRRAGYNSIKTPEEDSVCDEVDGKCEDIEEAQFIDSRNEVKPYKTLFLIFFLFFMGLLTLVISTLIMLGHLDEATYNDRMIPLMILGFLMFIPGAYYVRIVYFIVRGRQGYTYEMIPSCS